MRNLYRIKTVAFATVYFFAVKKNCGLASAVRGGQRLAAATVVVEETVVTTAVVIATAIIVVATATTLRE